LRHPYVLRGVLFCAHCGRRMDGAWRKSSADGSTGRTLYRCSLRATRSLTPNLADHPKSIYLREDAVLPELNGWIAKLVTPEALANRSGGLRAVLSRGGPEGPDRRARQEDQRLGWGDRSGRGRRTSVHPARASRWEARRSRRQAARRGEPRSPWRRGRYRRRSTTLAASPRSCRAPIPRNDGCTPH